MDLRRGSAAIRWTLAGAAVALLAGYGRLLFAGETLVLKDWLQHALPSHDVLASALRELRFPAWTDAVRFGIPFAANPDHRALYLPFWLLALLPSPLGTDLVVLAHVAAGGVGTGLLAIRWGAGRLGGALAALLFCCSGYVASALVLQMMPMLAWIPWVAWAADRVARSRPGSRSRSAAVFALVYSGLIVCGEPSSVITASWIAALLILSRGRARWPAAAALGGGAALGIALAAPVALPALELMFASSRLGGLDPATATRYSMHPARLLEVAWPGAFGGPSYTTHLGRVVADSAGLAGLGGDPSWAESVFLGVPALALAAVAAGRRRDLRALLVGAGAFTLLALGRFTPVYAAYRWLFLPERAARYPEKYVAGALVIAAALGGVGLSRWLRRRPSRAARAAVAAAAAALAAAWGLVLALRGPLADALVVTAASFPFPLDAGEGVGVALASGAPAVGAAAVFAAAFARGASAPSWARAAFLACAVALPVISNAWRVNPTVAREAVTRPPAILGAALAGGTAGRPRLLAQPPPGSARDVADGSSWAAHFHENAVQDVAARFGLQVLSGSDSFDTPAQDLLWRLGALARAPLTYAALGGADWAIVRPDEAVRSGAPVASSGGRMVLVRVRYARPRAFVTGDWFWVSPGEEVAALGGPDRLDRLERVSLTGAGAPPSAVPSPPAACPVSSPRPEHVIVQCNSEAGGYAVLLDAFAPGWSARVNGAPARIEAADGLFRAVRVGPGPQTIEYTYSVPGLPLGLGLGACALVAIGAALLRRVPARSGAGSRDAADAPAP